ncbi:uncharacterized protein LOC143283480 [Babylonia areolata]|uniref:uncharacterized protein LOC143283480 n=1 Tax=Babylonia areolata TaxID=304850 RepID=UPI003FD0ADB3
MSQPVAHNTFDFIVTFKLRELQQVLECLQMYILPVLICLGLGGSALGVTVLLATFLRFKFFTHFLVCLNVSSAAFLLVVFVSWLADNGIDVYSVPGLCQVHVFSSHFFPFLTVWHSVLGAYLVLHDWLRPGALHWLHSPTAAKTAVLGLSVLGFTMYSYKTWTHFAVTHRGSRVCTVIPENQPAMEVLNIVDVLVLLVIPSLLHALFVIIVLLLSHARGRRRRRRRGSTRSSLLPHCGGGGCCLGGGCFSAVSAKGLERVLYITSPGIVATTAATELEFVAPKRCGVGCGGGSGGGGGGGGGGGSGSGGGRRRNKTTASTTTKAPRSRCREVHRLVLSQSALFLLLVSPRAVSTLLVIVNRWVLRQVQSSDDILLLHVFQFSFYLYFALLPYCPALTSSKFRLHCCALFGGSSFSSSSSSSSSSSAAAALSLSSPSYRLRRRSKARLAERVTMT